jgi:cytochrome c553
LSTLDDDVIVARHDSVITTPHAGIGGEPNVTKNLASIAALLALCASHAVALDDVTHGKALYNGSAPGSYGCSGCHNVNDTSTEQNKVFRGAAGDPSLIDFAINTNPASTTEMRPLYGVGQPFELSDSDMSDLAAYINSVVNPGGAIPPTFKSTPSSANFGTVSVGTQSATRTFTVSNSGATGAINSVSSSNNAEFLLAGGTCLATPRTLAQNASCTVDVIFAPTLTGARSSTLTILGTGTPNPLTISLIGAGGATATPQGTLSGPGSATFGTQPLFVQSAAKSLTFTNVGTAGLVIAMVSNSNPAEFPVLSTSCAGAIAAAASCTISIAFTPSASGARAATLSIANDGATSPVTVQLSGSGAGATGGTGTKVAVTEYYNATLNHYFITPNTTEIALLGKPPFQEWQPTGLSFAAYAKTNPPAGTAGVCRFYNDHFLGVSTHFYAPHGLGCEATISQFPDWTLEDPLLFYANLPTAEGNCPAGTIPVYRMYNNAMGGAPNHRFTTDATVRQQLINAGYTAEGYGIGVGWCAQQ